MGRIRSSHINYLNWQERSELKRRLTCVDSCVSEHYLMPELLHNYISHFMFMTADKCIN